METTLALQGREGTFEVVKAKKDTFYMLLIKSGTDEINIGLSAKQTIALRTILNAAILDMPQEVKDKAINELSK